MIIGPVIDFRDLEMLPTGDEIWIRYSKLQELAEFHLKEKKQDVLPREYEKYKIIFDEKAAQRLPKVGSRGEWEHEIKIREGGQPPRNCKIYLLSLTEQAALDKSMGNTPPDIEQGTPVKEVCGSDAFLILQRLTV